MTAKSKAGLPGAAPVSALRHKLLKRAALWLLFLGPFFYASYGAANYLAAWRGGVPTVVFDWEQHIPFVAWTIFPYWSVNLFYAASVFLCRTPHELARHGRRLVTVQIIAVTGFLLWPLQFSFGQPAAEGLAGSLFTALRGFDQPFNQAPSLHIALVVILWDCYRRWLRAAWARWLLALWMLLICASVLTTFQHHFFDLPTGALLGVLCVWLWPLERRASPAGWCARCDAGHGRLALCYAVGATALAFVAVKTGGTWLWLLWPAVSLLLVAGCYARFGARGFQVGRNGEMSWAARVLFGPYLIAAWINSRLWTRGLPEAVEVIPGLWLGRVPSRGRWLPQSAPQGARTFTLCPELPLGVAHTGSAMPVLDLTLPTDAVLRRCVRMIDAQRRHGCRVLVCCALGMSRSAVAVAAWLVVSRRARSVDDAVRMLRAARPQVVLRAAHIAAIERIGEDEKNRD